MTGSDAEADNAAPAGLPTINGTPQVEQVLTADISAISDPDGLTSVTFEYQWIAGGKDLEGATGSSYLLTPSEQGQTIQVRVTFTDDRDYDETLTSEATETVAATRPGLPGHLHVFPHDAGALDVYWHAPASDGGSAITGYKLQWKENSDSWDIAADISETTKTGTTHTITGLTDGVEYSVRVRATNGVGDSPPSAEQSATPRETRPPEMVGIRVDGTTLKFTYDEALDQDAAPAPETFDVRVACSCDGTTWRDEQAKRGVESVSMDNATVVLTLVSAVTSENQVVVGYTPSTNAAAARIQDLAGNAAEAIRPTEALNYTQEEAEPETETEPEESEDSTTTDETGEEEEKTPLTVSLEASPDSHNGTDVFTFEIRFSEEFGLSYVTLRDKAFNVTGGKVDKAQRKQPGSNIGWTITVDPHGNGTVSITLPETTHCNDDGAICTAAGRMLSNYMTLTVSGPGQ